MSMTAEKVNGLIELTYCFTFYNIYKIKFFKILLFHNLILY
jgi:hypothetical protein